MHKCMDMNWDDLRFFLAIARAGSLTAAARQLKVNQSTVSRRLAAMERRLGARLFERGGDGRALTAAGDEVLETAENVEDEVLRIDRRVAGRDTRLKGHLRVTCMDIWANRLAPHFARFAAEHPEIDLTVATSYQHLSLARREADVAIRTTDKPPDTLVGRRLFTLAIAVYGAAETVDAMEGKPDPSQLDWIGWESEAYNRLMITNHYPTAHLRHRVDSLVVMRALVRAGLGVTVLGCWTGDSDPRLRRVYARPITDSGLHLWVLSHPDIRRAARVRAFTRFISEAILADRDLFEGRRPWPRARAAETAESSA